MELLMKVKCSSSDPASRDGVEKALIESGLEIISAKNDDYFDHWGIIKNTSYEDAFKVAKHLKRDAVGKILKISIHPA